MDDAKNYPPYLDYPKPYKPKTNADRIRAMRDEELAEVFEELCYDSMSHRAKYWLHWLQMPAEGE